MKFTTVVDYVKNLFPGRAPIPASDNPTADVNVLADMASNMFFTVASNGKSYWYYFVGDVTNLDVAKYMLHSNGVKVQKHNSHYFVWDKQPVLRVRRYLLNSDANARNFVEKLMTSNTVSYDENVIKTRIAEVKQKMK